MNQPIADLTTLLQHMAPVLNAGEYVFATIDDATALSVREVVASIREADGLSVVLDVETAQRLGLSTRQRFAWITLTVHSDLLAVGFTAAFATALGRAGISCNVVAGHGHDHIFVPFTQRDAAMAALRGLWSRAFAAGAGPADVPAERGPPALCETRPPCR